MRRPWTNSYGQANSSDDLYPKHRAHKMFQRNRKLWRLGNRATACRQLRLALVIGASGVHCFTHALPVCLYAMLILLVHPDNFVCKCQAQFASIDLEAPPIEYSKTKPNNRVSKLILALAKGERELEYERDRGYLRSLLHHLEISETSQVLVFSKTSLQVQHISPRNARAVYFNDDTYVGWIPGSSLVEISTNDPQLGAAFYSFQMSYGIARPRQETYQCLACHATSMTKGVPGHAVRSGHPNYDGVFDQKFESFVTDDASDFRQRWGGWYVTGNHGSLKHMGNSFLRGGVLDTTRNGNLQSLDGLLNVSKYLSPHSDLQALMILEHQTQMHNAFTRADFSVRAWMHEHANQEDKEQAERVRLIAKDVVDRLLFCQEFPLTTAVSGTSGFDQEFSARGPRDSNGRSLRELDMRIRMFKYPLSYLIYSEAFDKLQPTLRSEICGQITAVLQGDNQAEEYRHLTPELRQQILEIVQATKSDLLGEKSH